jgi:hypothetical protein
MPLLVPLFVVPLVVPMFADVSIVAAELMSVAVVLLPAVVP